MHDRVAAIDVHGDMVTGAVRVRGGEHGRRGTGGPGFRAFCGVPPETGRGLRRRGVTHGVTGAPGVCAGPVYHALAEPDFGGVMVISPWHAGALRGRKAGARDAIRLPDLHGCGLLPGSCVPAPGLREVRDPAGYRVKTVQARAPEVRRLPKTLETAGIRLSWVVSGVTGASATAMTGALIDGERRGGVPAGPAQGRLRAAGKRAGLSMALAGRFADRRAMMCRPRRDRIKVFDEAVAGLDAGIVPRAARYVRGADLPAGVPGSGDVAAAGWPGAIGPAPHRYLATAGRLASRAAVCPGSCISAGKSRGGRTDDGGACIRPRLVRAAWAAVRVPGRLQARFRRLVRRFGGARNGGAAKGAVIAVARTLLTIACQVLKAGTPCTDPGAGFCTGRGSPRARQGCLIRRLRKLNPGCAVTVTPAEAA
jgi:hypothetical protein